jgi:hypothetical protein
MKKVLIAALTVGILAGLGGYSLANHAAAQNAPQAQATDGTQPSERPQGWGRPRSMMGGEQNRQGRMEAARTWGLFSSQADKKLSAADVQTIANAILLRHGNHTWKVINVVQNQDDTVSFAFATQSGEVIAQFAMNTHSGRVRRIG